MQIEERRGREKLRQSAKRSSVVTRRVKPEVGHLMLACYQGDFVSRQGLRTRCVHEGHSTLVRYANQLLSHLSGVRFVPNNFYHDFRLIIRNCRNTHNYSFSLISERNTVRA